MDGTVTFDGDHQLGRYVNLRGSRQKGSNNKNAFLRQRAKEREKRENERKRNSASICIQANCWKLFSEIWIFWFEIWKLNPKKLILKYYPGNFTLQYSPEIRFDPETEIWYCNLSMKLNREIWLQGISSWSSTMKFFPEIWSEI